MPQKINEEFVGKQVDRVFVKRFSHIDRYQTLFECVCNCGNIIYKTNNALRRQKTVCCKQCRYNLVGKTFQFLYVDSISPVKTYGKFHYNCKCVCGEMVVIAGRELTNGKRKSCGCKNEKVFDRMDLTGQETDKFIVKEKTNRRLRKSCLYICVCKKCNKDIERSTLQIKANHGCFECFSKQSVTDARLNHMYSSYKITSKKKSREFLLTKEEFRKICTRNCHYCNSPPKQKKWHNERLAIGFTANGIDRVDNDKGYTIENCVPCCSICNRMKTNLGYIDFINHIKNIYHHLSGENV